MGVCNGALDESGARNGSIVVAPRTRRPACHGIAPRPRDSLSSVRCGCAVKRRRVPGLRGVGTTDAGAWRASVLEYRAAVTTVASAVGRRIRCERRAAAIAVAEVERGRRGRRGRARRRPGRVSRLLRAAKARVRPWRLSSSVVLLVLVVPAHAHDGRAGVLALAESAKPTARASSTALAREGGPATALRALCAPRAAQLELCRVGHGCRCVLRRSTAPEAGRPAWRHAEAVKRGQHRSVPVPLDAQRQEAVELHRQVRGVQPMARVSLRSGSGGRVRHVPEYGRVGQLKPADGAGRP
mmetsp:Transcript_23674/g.60932  ORF Transcript_23674/g.60932 Transcript_23674/m.60932 type:complete len:298 (+) Transcript_23674:326-1219(+)